MKWTESGFRPPLCTYRLYRLNWTRRTWWDDWDDTVLQTQDSKFEPWLSEAEHATSRSRRLPTILTLTRGWGRNIFCFFQTAETGNRTPNSGVKGSGANHYPRAPAHVVVDTWHTVFLSHGTPNSNSLEIDLALVLFKPLQLMNFSSIKFKFSVTWSCVSLPRFTASSDWKVSGCV